MFLMCLTPAALKLLPYVTAIQEGDAGAVNSIFFDRSRYPKGYRNMKEHFKHFLGKAAESWSNGHADELAILLFKNQPQPGISTYATYKMSNHSLALNKEKKVRQELIISVYEKYESDKIAGTLLSFAKHVIESGSALRRGEAIGLGTPFVTATELIGVYASSPVFFKDKFHVCADVMPPVVKSILEA